MRRQSLSRGPDRDAALEQYRRRAGVYDWELSLFEPLRSGAVAMLELRPGDVVLDVGCGTGLSLALLKQGIGTRGRIVGIEQCPEMIEQARSRVAKQHWSGVTLLCSPVETVDFSGQADAALFHFTHDILRCPEAIANVVRHLKPGARVVASGLKWAAPWPPWSFWPLSPVNLFVLPAALRSVTSLDGMAAPWGLLQEQLGPMEVESLLLGGAYVARGTCAAG